MYTQHRSKTVYIAQELGHGSYAKVFKLRGDESVVVRVEPLINENNPQQVFTAYVRNHRHFLEIMSNTPYFTNFAIIHDIQFVESLVLKHALYEKTYTNTIIMFIEKCYITMGEFLKKTHEFSFVEKLRPDEIAASNSSCFIDSCEDLSNISRQQYTDMDASCTDFSNMDIDEFEIIDVYNKLILDLVKIVMCTSENKFIIGDLTMNNVMIMEDFGIKIIDYLNGNDLLIAAAPPPEYIDNYVPESTQYDYTKNNEYNYTFDFIGLFSIIFYTYSKKIFHSIFLRELYTLHNVNTMEYVLYIYNKIIKKMTEYDAETEIYNIHESYRNMPKVAIIDEYFERKSHIINKDTILIYLKQHNMYEDDIIFDADLLFEFLLDMIKYDYRERKIDIKKLTNALLME